MAIREKEASKDKAQQTNYEEKTRRIKAENTKQYIRKKIDTIKRKKADILVVSGAALALGMTAYITVPPIYEAHRLEPYLQSPKIEYHTQMAENFVNPKFRSDELGMKFKILKQSGVNWKADLVNGHTDKNWWAQYGLDYQPSENKFFFTYEIWNPKSESVIPKNSPGRGLMTLPFQPKEGDVAEITVQIKNNITQATLKINGKVVLQKEDQVPGNAFVGGNYANPSSFMREMVSFGPEFPKMPEETYQNTSKATPKTEDTIFYESHTPTFAYSVSLNGAQLFLPSRYFYLNKSNPEEAAKQQLYIPESGSSKEFITGGKTK